MEHHITIDKKVNQLINSLKSLIITSLKEDGSLSMGYLPFVRKDNKLYVFTSNLAEHGANLEAGRQASIMFIEDEQNTQTITIRKRAMFAIDYHVVAMEQGQEIIDLFQTTHGEVYAMLKQMSDFTLYVIELKNGRFVQGYGAAFLQNDQGIWEHLSADKIKKSSVSSF